MLSFIGKVLRWATSSVFILLLISLFAIFIQADVVTLWAIPASIVLALALTAWIEIKWTGWTRWAKSDPAKQSYDRRFGPGLWRRLFSRAGSGRDK